LSEMPPEIRELDNLLVINATSLGLRENDPSPLSLSGLSSGAKVYDMIYSPPETALLKEAESLGMPGANGLSMLVHQAAKALEIWTEARVPSEVMLREARLAMEVER